jgi:hypothetical protein
MSKTGDALEALYAALLAKSQEPSPRIPAPTQNDDLPRRVVETGGTGLRMYLNVWDSAGDEPDESLGADVIADGYEIELPVAIELAVVGGTREERRAAFEAALEAIDDAVAADRTLGGAVDRAAIRAPRRTGNGLITDGIPNVLAADITAVLSFTSSRPF